MTKAEREALEEIATGLGLAYSAVSHNRTDEALLHIGHHEAKLRALLATLDKPATRYPWDQAPEWAMFATTDPDGTRCWFRGKPRPDVSWWVPDGLDAQWEDVSENANAEDWRESLERRPDAP